VGGVSAGHKRLGGDAAVVDARAPNEFALDDGDGLTGRGQPTGERRTGLAGANDDGVELARHDEL
jgi:hypothetical protein